MYDQTVKFFQAVLPPSAVYFLAIAKQGKSAPAHKAFTDIETMAKAVAKFDQDPTHQVYHACSGYEHPYIEVQQGDKLKKQYRKPNNWKEAKAFWVDVDCGEEKYAKGEGYLEKKTAAMTMLAFAKTVGLPKPMIVDSGNGMHFYWPLTEPIGHEEWRRVATQFKAVLEHYGVIADPSRTADFASILRPPGSTHKKDLANQRQVKLLTQTWESTTPEDFAHAMALQVSNHALFDKQLLQKLPDLNDDLTAHLGPSIPSFAEIAATRCAQMAAMRDTKGDVGYDHWRGVIGIIKHCEEGIELAAAWSANRAETGHSQTDYVQKFETWSAGPTTCEFFNKCNPSLCQGCPERDNERVKSPIMLGRVQVEQKEELLEVVEQNGTKTTYEIPALPLGFRHEDGVMIRDIKRDDVIYPTTFCSELFYLTAYIRDIDGTYKLNVRHHNTRGAVRDFQINAEDTAAERDTVKALIRNNVLPTASKEGGVSIHAYVRSSFERLKQETDEVHTYQKFSWHDNYTTFLIGDRLYMPDGSIRRVLLSKTAQDCANYYPEPVGTLKGYSDALNYVYAKDGMEPMQYMIASAFGSLLTPFSEQLYHGILCAVVGGRTARGKTTGCYAGMYAFGDAGRTTIKTDQGATVNARYAMLAVTNGLPVTIDELTSIDARVFSDLVYAISNGEEKIRMTSTAGGVRMAVQNSWNTAPLGNGNGDLMGRLAEHVVNSQAEAVRLIQINIDRYKLPKFEDGEVDSYLHQMSRNMGMAGDAFIRYIVQNSGSLIQRVAKWVARIGQTLNGQEFRFYRSHVGCTMAACEIMVELGICDFDIEKLFNFVVVLMTDLKSAVQNNNTLTPKTAFAQMLSDAGPRIIVTQGYRDNRDARGPELTKSFNQEPVGRWIQGSKTTDNPLGGRAYITRKFIKEWCAINRFEAQLLFDYADEIGCLIHDKDDRFTLGRGTQHMTGVSRCAGFDYDKYLSLNNKVPAIKPALKSVSNSKASDVSKSGTDDL